MIHVRKGERTIHTFCRTHLASSCKLIFTSSRISWAYRSFNAMYLSSLSQFVQRATRSAIDLGDIVLRCSSTLQMVSLSLQKRSGTAVEVQLCSSIRLRWAKTQGESSSLSMFGYKIDNRIPRFSTRLPGS